MLVQAAGQPLYNKLKEVTGFQEYDSTEALGGHNYRFKVHNCYVQRASQFIWIHIWIAHVAILIDNGVPESNIWQALTQYKQKAVHNTNSILFNL